MLNTQSFPKKRASAQDNAQFATRQPVIKVIGLGGGGCNAINRMIELGLHGVEFIAANTDYQAMKNSLAATQIQLGPNLTRGLGAGGRPEVGQAAAEESRRALVDALRGADMVFLTAGLGGGTGTGSIPVAAEVARSLGAVTIAVVTTPFSFEMGRRQRNANEGLAKLREHTNTLISIPNDRLLYVAPRDLPMEVAFRLADDVLRQAVQGITELITEPGLINVDFAHIRRLMQLGGGALMSIGQGTGPNKAYEAVLQALNHPLLDTISLANASGIIANFTGGDDLTLFEMGAALSHLHTEAGDQAEVVMGVINETQMKGRAQVILVVTGLGAPTLEETMSAAQKQPARPQPVVAVPQVAHAVVAQAHVAGGAAQPIPVITPTPVHARVSAKNNLDLPAFMRRRYHAGQ